MVDNFQSPVFILTAVKRIYPLLPQFIGADWQRLAPQIDSLIASLERQLDNYLASTQLIALLASYEATRQRLSEELLVQEIIAWNLQEPYANEALGLNERLMASLMAGLDWEVDSSTLPSAEEKLKTNRTISMKDGGVAGAKSLKFKNLDLDVGKMMTVAAGFFLTTNEIMDKKTPFIIVGGILVMLGTLLGEMTVTIEQQEATVFWGFITETNERPRDQHHVDAVFVTSNSERRKRGLVELEREAFNHSLYKLEQLGSILRLDEHHYRVIEQIKVKK